MPKLHKFSLGEKVDKIFVEVIDGIVTANFLNSREKQPFVHFAIRKLDILKVFLMMLWETKSLDNKKYIALSEKLNEVGRNLGGWYGKLLKENSLSNNEREIKKVASEADGLPAFQSLSSQL